jgi:dolichyl-diphosphooligosaccharide--protein glycosyltransferase
MQPLSLSQLLRRIVDHAELSVIGLIAFTLFALWRWRQMIPLIPVLLLGVLALVSSPRFVAYLAPFVGIGWGVVIGLITSNLGGGVVSRRNGGSGSMLRRVVPGSPRFPELRLAKTSVMTAFEYTAVLALFFIWFAPNSARGSIPGPATVGPVFAALQELDTRLPHNSRLWTWWDLGFVILDTTSFGVYHDGAAQYTPQTNFIAASFVYPDQQLMHDVIHFVDHGGNRAINRLATQAENFDTILAGIRQSSRPRLAKPVHVLFTPDMLLKYSSMRRLSPTRPAEQMPEPGIGIQWLACDRIVADVMRCGSNAFDLRTGKITRSDRADAGNNQLRRAVMIESGKILRQREFSVDAQLSVEIIFESGELLAVYLLDEAAFASNMNQMFCLGRYDDTRFEEVFNEFPYARVFRALSVAD